MNYLVFCVLIILNSNLQNSSKWPVSAQVPENQTQSKDIPSVYDSVYNAIESLKDAQEAIVYDYRELTRNNTSNIANWLAYSQILKQVNSVLIDQAVQHLINSDIKLQSDCFTSMFDFLNGINKQKTWTYKSIEHYLPRQI